MSHQAKVIYTALGILVSIVVLAYLTTMTNPGDKYAALGFGLLVILAAVAEALILLITGIYIRVKQRSDHTTSATPDPKVLDDTATERPLGYKQRARAYFLAAGLVLLVGGSLCFGGVALS